MDNNIETDVENSEERFADILSQLKEGKDLSNDDGLFLVELVRGLDHSYSIVNSVLSTLGRELDRMAQGLAFSVLSRAGRTDQKIKKSVLKICDQYTGTLWYNAREEAAAVAQALLSMQQAPTENTEEEAE